MTYTQEQKDIITSLDRHLVVVANAGCLTGDTIISFNRSKKGFKQSISDAYIRFNNIRDTGYKNKIWTRNIPTRVRSFVQDEKIIKLNEVESIWYSGKKPIFKLVLENGFELKGTAIHPVLTEGNVWVKLGELTPEHKVMVDLTTRHQKKKNATGRTRIKYKRSSVGIHYPNGRFISNNKIQEMYYSYTHILVYEAFLNNLSFDEFITKTYIKEECDKLIFVDRKINVVHHKDHNPLNNNIDNLQLMLQRDHAILHSQGYKNFGLGVPEFVKVKEVIDLHIEEDTYDISCKSPNNNFVANGIIVHNTGKTTTIIEKIKHLLDHNLTDASKIMLTSFSRVAASELYEKAVKSVGVIKADQMQIGTIHAICYKVILENIKLLGINNIDIKSEAYLTAVVYNRHNNLYDKKKDVAKDVAKYRRYLFDKVYPKEIGDDKFNAIHDCQLLLESEGKYLYDDLLLKTIQLFNKYPEIRKQWQDRFEWIITDESQDNSKAQWDIIELLINDKTNTVVVGDAKQNIYQFRGCSYLFLEDYRKKMNAKVLPLTQTFRFGQAFADVSNRIIDNLDIDETYKKHTITKIERNTKPEFKQVKSYEQPDDVVLRIKEFIESGYSYKDMNVVYRYNKEAIPFMKSFIKNKIPFAVKSGDVFERQEIQFVINALKLMKQFTINDCNILFSMYSDFIGDKTLTSIYKEVNHENMTALSFLEKSVKTDIQGVGYVKRKSLLKMKERIENLDSYIKTKENSIPTIANILDIDDTKFMIKELENANNGNPSEDRKEFLIFFQECFRDSGKEDILDWYNEVILNGHKVKEKDTNSVYLKTIHGCKGQTLPIVFFIADSIADKRFYKEDEDAEPEKFVLYVGLTRAEKHMIIYIANPVEFRFSFIFPEEWQNQIKVLKLNGSDPLKEEKSEPKVSSEVSKSDKKLKNNVIVKHTTDRAILFEMGTSQFWIPLQFVSSKEGRYYLTSWVVKKNNLMKYIEETV